jgi:hypothetical protein
MVDHHRPLTAAHCGRCHDQLLFLSSGHFLQQIEVWLWLLLIFTILEKAKSKVVTAGHLRETFFSSIFLLLVNAVFVIQVIS